MLRPLTICANIEVMVGLGSIILGFLLIFSPNTQLFEAYNATISTAFWGEENLSEAALRMNHWLLATCGAGVVGWGLTWVAIAHIPLRRGETWAWFSLVVSLVAWVFLDLCIALWFGVSGEVVFVLIALFIGLLPLMFITPQNSKKH